MIANQTKQIKDFIWVLSNKEDILSDESNRNKCLLIRNISSNADVTYDSIKKYIGDHNYIFDSLESAVSSIKATNHIDDDNCIVYPCKLSQSSYLSNINLLMNEKNIYRVYILIYINDDCNNLILSPYILMEVGDYMPIGAQVYHENLRLNLIVCQINSGNIVTCIDPNIHTNGVFRTLNVKFNTLKLGWRHI